MKNQIKNIGLFLFTFFGVAGSAAAQCIIDTSVHKPGIDQMGQYCFPQGTYSEHTWQYKSYDSIRVFIGGNYISATPDSLSIDSIINLPCGMTFIPNKPMYEKFENGCILVKGTADDSIGSYNVILALTAYVHGLNDTFGNPIPCHVYSNWFGGPGIWYVRVLGNQATCTPPDTTTSNLLVQSCSQFIDGINDQPALVNNFSNSPNPFSTTTQIAFTAEQSKKVTFKVFDLVGKTLHEETLQTTEGRNIINFNRKGLTNGIYFYSITDGNQSFTNKMMIAD